MRHVDLTPVRRLRWIIVLAATLWVVAVLAAAFYPVLADFLNWRPVAVERRGGHPADPRLWIGSLIVIVGATALVGGLIWWAVTLSEFRWAVALRDHSQNGPGDPALSRITAVVTAALVAFEVGLGLFPGWLVLAFLFDHNSLTAPLGMHHLFRGLYQPLALCGFVLVCGSVPVLAVLGPIAVARAVLRRFGRTSEMERDVSELLRSIERGTIANP
jgi:hypothetical protein